MAKDTTTRAKCILDAAEDSVKNFLKAFDTVRQAERKPAKGAPTNEEQDLARAALVFAAAGLDSSIKQLIRDCVGQLARSHQDVQRGLWTYVERQLLRGLGDEGDNGGRKSLARVLAADSPRKELINQYILDLTGTSLQSGEQVRKAASALGLNPDDLPAQKKDLDDIFKVRNQIVHEFDMKFLEKVGHRNRNRRQKQTLEAYSNKLIEVGKHLIKAVEDKMAEKPSTDTKAPE